MKKKKKKRLLERIVVPFCCTFCILHRRIIFLNCYIVVKGAASLPSNVQSFELCHLIVSAYQRNSYVRISEVLLYCSSVLFILGRSPCVSINVFSFFFERESDTSAIGQCPFSPHPFFFYVLVCAFGTSPFWTSNERKVS